MSHEEGYVKLQAEAINLKDQVEKLEAREKKQRVDNKRDTAELLSLRRQVSDAKKKEETLQQEIDDLNEQLDVAMMTPQQSSVFFAAKAEKNEGGISKADLDKKIQEVRVEEQLAAEEELFAITGELEEQIEGLMSGAKAQARESDRQKEEIAALKKQLGNINNNATPVKSSSGDSSAALERALAEKAIAIRMKDGAVASAGAAQAELEKSSGTMSDLKAQVITLSEQLEDARSNPGSTPGRYRDPEAGNESFGGANDSSPSSGNRILQAQLSEKEKLVQYLQDRVSQVEIKNSELQNEKEGLTNTKSTDYLLLEQRIRELQEENELQLVKHNSDVERLQVDMQIVTAERDKSMAAGKRAFLERNQALSDVKAAEQKQAQVQRLQQKIVTSQRQQSEVCGGATGCDRGAPPAESAVARELQTVMGHTDTTFDHMLARMEAVEDDTEKREAIYETLFEKEHEILNLKNDQMSMATIRKIQEEDLESQLKKEFGTKTEELLSTIEIQRIEIADLKEAAEKAAKAAAGATPVVTGGGV